MPNTLAQLETTSDRVSGAGRITAGQWPLMSHRETSRC